MHFKKTMDSINSFLFNLNNISRLLANEYYITEKKREKTSQRNNKTKKKKCGFFYSGRKR